MRCTCLWPDIDMAMFPFLTSPIKSYLKTSLLWRLNGFSAEFASYAPQPHRNVEIPGQDRQMCRIRCSQDRVSPGGTECRGTQCWGRAGCWSQASVIPVLWEPGIRKEERRYPDIAGDVASAGGGLGFELCFLFPFYCSF